MWLFKPMSRRQMALACGALCAVLAVYGTVGEAREWARAGEQVRADTLRLHVRAASDTVHDQTVKLAVRDELLAVADSSCPSGGKAAALEWAARSLPRLELEAALALAQAGESCTAELKLVNMYFDTAAYTGAQLPAGRYDALRVEIGGENCQGKNWWCVLYPGLCRAACGGYARESENDLVCGEYIVRFKLVDWWQKRTAERGDELLLSV